MGLSGLVDKTVKMNKKPVRIEMIDIDDINENDLNFYSQEGIDELASNIKLYGLLKPLEVYEEDGSYTLLGGHRRLKALKKLFDNDEIDAEVPCLIYGIPEKENKRIEERLKIITSNAQRELTKDDKIQITKELLEILENNEDVKPSGMTTREWIAPYLGCSARTVQSYINEVKGEKEEVKEKEVKEKTPSQKMNQSRRDILKCKESLVTFKYTFSNLILEDGFFDSEEEQIQMNKNIEIILNNISGLYSYIDNKINNHNRNKGKV